MGSTAIEQASVPQETSPLGFLLDEADADPAGQEQLQAALQSIVDRIETDQDAVILITGEPGRGKSTLGLQLGRLLTHATNQDFGIQDVHWTALTYMDYVNELIQAGGTRGKAIMLDEGLSGAFGRDAQRRENKSFQKFLSVVRWLNLVHIICAPRLHSMDENLRNDRVTHWIHLDDVGEAWLHEKRELTYKSQIWFDKVAQFRFPPLNPHDHPLYRRYLLEKDVQGKAIMQGFIEEAHEGAGKRS